MAINRALRKLREALFTVLLHLHTQALDWTLEKGEVVYSLILNITHNCCLMPEGGLSVLPDLMCWSTWLLDKPWKNVHYTDMDNLVCKCCLMSSIELVVRFHVSFKS